MLPGEVRAEGEAVDLMRHVECGDLCARELLQLGRRQLGLRSDVEAARDAGDLHRTVDVAPLALLELAGARARLPLALLEVGRVGESPSPRGIDLLQLRAPAAQAIEEAIKAIRAGGAEGGEGGERGHRTRGNQRDRLPATRVVAGGGQGARVAATLRIGARPVA